MGPASDEVKPTLKQDRERKQIVTRFKANKAIAHKAWLVTACLDVQVQIRDVINDTV